MSAPASAGGPTGAPAGEPTGPPAGGPAGAPAGRRFGTGLVVGKFYPPHAGHHYLIDTAARGCAEVTVLVAPSRRESIPLALRCDWLRERHPGVRVVGGYDDIEVDYADPAVWDAHCALFRDLTGLDRVDSVWSSEAYGEELARRFGAVPVCVDPDRRAVPVSGSAVRADPVGYWHALAAPVRAWFARRVVVVGAESTGTTTLARALAAHYATDWVPEYGRELTARKLAALRAGDPAATVFDLRWSDPDFVEVAVAQNAAEDAAAGRGGPVLVCDTDARATAVWQERYLGVATAAVTALARRPALYLLTDHDGVPFHDDGLRDGEQVRAWMTNRFRQVLATTGVPVVELSGPHPARLERAVRAVDRLLAAGWALTEPIAERRRSDRPEGSP